MRAAKKHRKCEHTGGCPRAGWKKWPLREGPLFCTGHWRRMSGALPMSQPIQERWKNGTTCRAVDCLRQPIAKGLCSGHYERSKYRTPDLSTPIRENGRQLDYKADFRMPAYAWKALRARSEARGVSVAALVRALVEKWAMTDGAEVKPVVESGRSESAWAKAESEMSREH